MMTIQAKELMTPCTYPGQSLRTYPVDSPRAKARLIILALLADGRLDAVELESLSRRKTFEQLQISREDFFQVFHDFCEDVAGMPSDSSSYLISPPVLDNLLGEIRSVDERPILMRLIFDVIRSDGRVAEGEARLFWNALDAWDMRLDERFSPVAAASSGNASANVVAAWRA